MERMQNNNRVRLCGVMAGPPVYSHSSRGLDFHIFPLRVERLSGNTDTLNVLVRSTQLEALDVGEGTRLLIEGEVRSFISRRTEGARLVITVLARELSFAEGEDENLVELTGTLCKAPNPRTTPMGREICDLMVAVNRRYGRSDYLPCICWGPAAREAAGWSVGTRLRLTGRLQSRDYIKLTDEGAIQRTAYEISATELSCEASDGAF